MITGRVLEKISEDKNELENYMNGLLKIDEKYKVAHNFSGVQCLNCHSVQIDHPFEDKKIKDKNMQTRCLKCHNSHQTPGWYQVQENGLPGELNGKKFKKALGQIACPGMD